MAGAGRRASLRTCLTSLITSRSELKVSVLTGSRLTMRPAMAHFTVAPADGESLVV